MRYIADASEPTVPVITVMTWTIGMSIGIPFVSPYPWRVHVIFGVTNETRVSTHYAAYMCKQEGKFFAPTKFVDRACLPLGDNTFNQRG
jgi:hypothetical protein